MLTVIKTKAKTKIEGMGSAGINLVESSGRLGLFLILTISRLWMYRFPVRRNH